MNLIFDVDDTLYNLMQPFEKTHQELFARQTNADCEELFKASRIYSDEAFYMHQKGLITKEEEFVYRIRKTYADVDIFVSEETAKKFEERYRYYQKYIYVPDQMKEILDYCRKKKVFIAALTNGKHKNQSKKIEALQLGQWFQKERIFISEDIGYTKPDPKAFLAVQSALNLKPEETWFIGDTFEVDVIGAGRAGWKSIWFNHRHRRRPEIGVQADYEAKSYKELFYIVKKIIAI